MAATTIKTEVLAETIDAVNPQATPQEAAESVQALLAKFGNVAQWRGRRPALLTLATMRLSPSGADAFAQQLWSSYSDDVIAHLLVFKHVGSLDIVKAISKNPATGAYTLVDQKGLTDIIGLINAGMANEIDPAAYGVDPKHFKAFNPAWQTKRGESAPRAPRPKKGESAKTTSEAAATTDVATSAPPAESPVADAPAAAPPDQKALAALASDVAEIREALRDIPGLREALLSIIERLDALQAFAIQTAVATRDALFSVGQAVTPYYSEDEHNANFTFLDGEVPQAVSDAPQANPQVAPAVVNKPPTEPAGEEEEEEEEEEEDDDVAPGGSVVSAGAGSAREDQITKAQDLTPALIQRWLAEDTSADGPLASALARLARGASEATKGELQASLNEAIATDTVRAQFIQLLKNIRPETKDTTLGTAVLIRILIKSLYDRRG